MLRLTNYQITEQLHESANSVVYRGTRCSDNLPVVLKVLRDEYPSPKKIAWFKREYDVTRQLDMDEVVDVYAIENDQHRWIMVLEDFGGTSLAQLQLAGKLDIDDFLTLAIKWCDRLAQVHARHIMHKDINPANLVLNRETEQVKLIDFGISTVLEREKQSFRNPNQLEGTLAYISPEQTGRMNRAIDYRTDFYSLGVSFYELLTGQLPFAIKDPLALIHAHIAKQPIPPHEIKRHVPTMLSAIVLKLMAKNAEERYLSVYGLKHDLERVKATISSLLPVPFELGQHDFSNHFRIPQKLYGRTAEIDQLLASVERISAGASELMLVAGYSGIGKSALVQEVYKPLTQRRGYFMAGKFDQLQRDIPYSAFIQAFEALFRQLLTESEAAIASWQTRLLNALGPNGQVIIDVLPEVELIIGPQPTVPELPPMQAKNRFNLVFEKFIRVFTQVEHPLVIFLDDLQWADGASLNMMELLLNAPNSAYLLLIGAYRDNEVSAEHPLTLTLSHIQEANVKVDQILLTPLTLDDTTTLVADTLRQRTEMITPLARLVFDKTGGNPFFLVEFLKTLYAENLLYFEHKQNRWQWKFTQIQARQMTDNVVDLMTQKMRQLPATTQNALRLAACIGNTFGLPTLALILGQDSQTTAQQLFAALDAGLVVPLSDSYKLVEFVTEKLDGEDVIYRFAHDRVQQAGYALIPLAEKEAIHWQVGQLLWQNTATDALEQHIFDIVNHLNAGATEASSSDHEKLSRLNLQAGQKAKASAAYVPALHYFNSGLGFLAVNSWENQYALTLTLHNEAAEAASLSGEFERAEALIETVLRQAKTPLDRVKAYEISIESQTQRNPRQAIINGRNALADLGVRVPAKPTMLHIAFALLRIKLFLRGKSIDDLLHNRVMTDPKQLATIQTLLILTAPANTADKNLTELIVLKMIELIVRYGNSAFASYGYAVYAAVLGGVLGEIDAGREFEKLAQTLSQLHSPVALQCKVGFVIYGHVHHYTTHLRDGLQPLLDLYQASLDTGNLAFASNSIMFYCMCLSSVGENLSKTDTVIATYSTALASMKQKIPERILSMYWQTIRNLMGKTDHPSRLLGPIYNVAQHLATYQKENDKLLLALCFSFQTRLAYLFWDYEEAFKQSKLAATYAKALQGTPDQPIRYFFRALANLAYYPQASRKEQRHSLRRVAAIQKQMRKWADHAPMNNLHKWHLIEAERARVLGKEREARQHYDKAIALAQEHQYLNEEALAYERAGLFYEELAQPHVAQLYLRDAHYAYQRWGAYAKVTQLEAQYPFLAQSQVKPTATTKRITTTTGELDVSELDLHSILKASQAISGEIHLPKLLDTLMQLVIENAGAEHGYLLLDKDGVWDVAAFGKIGFVPTQDILSKRTPLPQSIINYVVRKQENVVLDDATHAGLFTQDQYMQTHKPKSVLCAPLINQGRLIGILYLENNLTTGAFTPDRLEVLNLLSSQAAISIENATLYNTLEQKVTERTRETEEARAAAEQANQAKSTFLANMSHELRTPLNAILGFAQIMQRRKRDDATDQQQLDIIRRSGEHLLNLINSVLDLSKIEAGKISLNPNNFDLLLLLEELKGMFLLPAKDKGLYLSFEIAPDLPRYVRTDSVKLRQVLINLLSNAIKFTKEGGVSLHVSQSVLAGQLHIEIADSGVGIAAEELATLFEAFSQTQSGKYKQEGTGLGLPISQQFVRLMGGEIIVESQLGRGTRFMFDMQVEELDANQIKQKQATRRVVALAPNQPRYRILIVDDKWDNRQLLINLLKPLGFELQEASNGQEAIAVWHEWQPDLIWMDIRMPVMDGYEATRQIKRPERRGFRHLGGLPCPIIALTASIYEEEQAAILEAGCDDFLRKPFRSEQIFDLMNKHLGVRYIYEQDAPPSQEMFATSSPLVSTASSKMVEGGPSAALSSLPAEWRKRFHQAVTELNLSLMQAQIEEVHLQNEPLADMLTGLVNNFQFEKLSNLLEEAEDVT